MATDRSVRVGVYARVSTVDKNQDPTTQLLPLRAFITAQEGWTLTTEETDHASATDLPHRTGWQRLLTAASRRQVDCIVVWRMDRAFRSVFDAAQTLERFRGWGVGLRSYQEPWIDTTSPFGEALYFITIAYAGLERGILSERVKAGMARARQQGRILGRPHLERQRPDFSEAWATLVPALQAGRISKREAARVLKVSEATVRRRLAHASGAAS